MSRLADYLSEFAGRPVVDETGVAGTYGLSLDFARDNRDDRPSVFTALQAQAGLRLEPKKDLVDFMVIDQIQKPSGN